LYVESYDKTEDTATHERIPVNNILDRPSGWSKTVKQSHNTQWRRRGRGGIVPIRPFLRHYRRWVVSATSQARFTHREKFPGTHKTGGWVGPRTGLDTEVREKILLPLQGSKRIA
jgi:hypothetical protein